MKCVSVNFTVEPSPAWGQDYGGWRVLRYRAARLPSGTIRWLVWREKVLEHGFPTQFDAEQDAIRTGIYRPMIYNNRTLDDSDLVQFMLEEM